jgi:hypothetical protein
MLGLRLWLYFILLALLTVSLLKHLYPNLRLIFKSDESFSRTFFFFYLVSFRFLLRFIFLLKFQQIFVYQLFSLILNLITWFLNLIDQGLIVQWGRKLYCLLLYIFLGNITKSKAQWVWRQILKGWHSCFLMFNGSCSSDLWYWKVIPVDSG